MQVVQYTDIDMHYTLHTTMYKWCSIQIQIHCTLCCASNVKVQCRAVLPSYDSLCYQLYQGAAADTQQNLVQGSAVQYYTVTELQFDNYTIRYDKI